MIKAIIFDCFGVLTEDVWVVFCAGLDPEVAKRAHELSHQRNRGFLSDDEFLDQVAEVTGRPIEDVRATRANITNNGMAKNTPLIEYIGKLKRAGYQIGILSNIGSNWITEELLTPDEQQLFDQLILSFEVGVTKPDPRIYQIAANRFGLTPEQMVFIDDQASYVEAAKEQGMHGITYADFTQMKRELEALLDANK